jgi:uncharacterized protein (TIGR02118 family)
MLNVISDAILRQLIAHPKDRTMVSNSTPATMYVIYEGTPETHFDRAYYETHLTQVREVMTKFGLVSANAFYTEAAESRTLVVTELRFRDEEALSSAFAAPEVAELRGDIPNFTDGVPTMWRLTPAQ